LDEHSHPIKPLKHLLFKLEQAMSIPHVEELEVEAEAVVLLGCKLQKLLLMSMKSV